jgi:hypothetical protein
MAVNDKAKKILLERARVLIKEQERFLDLLEKDENSEILRDFIEISFKEMHDIFARFGEKDADKESAGGVIDCMVRQCHYATLLRKHTENEKEVV